MRKTDFENLILIRSLNGIPISCRGRFVVIHPYKKVATRTRIVISNASILKKSAKKVLKKKFAIDEKSHVSKLKK